MLKVMKNTPSWQESDQLKLRPVFWKSSYSATATKTHRCDGIVMFYYTMFLSVQSCIPAQPYFLVMQRISRLRIRTTLLSKRQIGASASRALSWVVARVDNVFWASSSGCDDPLTYAWFIEICWCLRLEGDDFSFVRLPDHGCRFPHLQAKYKSRGGLLSR